MSEDIGLFEAIYSQRAVRYLKPDPIPETTLQRLIEAAVKAPSGGNSQPWKFLIIRDEELRNASAATTASPGRESTASKPPPRRPSPQGCEGLLPTWRRTCTVPQPSSWPALSTTVAPLPWVGALPYTPPFRIILLAARGLGLGSALTTLHKGFEDEIKSPSGHP